MKKGEVLELNIEDYAFEGKGLARIDVEHEGETKKFVIFVNGSYPGDTVKAEIRRKKKSYAEAIVKEIITPSPDRVEPECEYFGVCGGCKAQDLDYDVQVNYKAEQVRDIFERIGGLTDFEILPPLSSPRNFFYRNKMEFSFAEKRWLYPHEIESGAAINDKKFALGLHIPRMFDKVLDINKCYLQSEESNKILNFTRDFFKSKDIPVYSTRTHEGYLRHLVIKQSHFTKDLMVNLVTSEENHDLFSEYTKSLLEVVPEITTIINNINEKKAQVAYGDYEIIYHGDGYIFDTIGKYKFRISANSFFQTNTLQAEFLYQTALDFADLKGDETVYDLYSGAGTISIYVSGSAKNVIGFETVDPAVEDAFYNAGLNNIENIHFVSANLDKSFLRFIDEQNLPEPDVIIADPPRGGMNPKTVADILKLSPEKLVYVSCNPSTQARDIKMLEEGGYKLVKYKPVDMFPHTYHVENVALLVKQ